MSLRSAGSASACALSVMLSCGVLAGFSGAASADTPAQPAYQPAPIYQPATPAYTPRAASAATSKPNNGRIIVQEENDYFVSNDDKHYTQGARVSYLSGTVTPDGMWDKPYEFLGSFLPIFQGGGDRKRKYEMSVGQSIFTPTNTTAPGIIRRDRPYAAWLYAGNGFLQETKSKYYNTLENLEFQGGVVGSAAFGDVTQNDFHQFIDEKTSVGWQNQLRIEPGFMATYERKWRFGKTLFGNFGVDAIPEAGATVGNIMTYGQLSGMVRIGQNLGADYGPDRIRPSLSGTGWFDADQLKGSFGWYLFAGTQGRAVGHNIFLDGNTFASSASVDKKPLVADFTGGASVFWSDWVRADFSYVERTKEFYGQQGPQDRFGGINVSFLFF